jgi:hypothetical protein
MSNVTYIIGHRRWIEKVRGKTLLEKTRKLSSLIDELVKQERAEEEKRNQVRPTLILGGKNEASGHK